MRRGEIENCLECLGPSSCIFPIAREAVHIQQAGSREAVKHFTAYLERAPGDLRVRWLLNLAYMTLGEYPEKVPPAFLIPLDRSARSSTWAGSRTSRRGSAWGSGAEPGRRQHLRRFQRRRPARPAHDLDRCRPGASLFINRGDGTFEDRSAAAGLGQQIYVLNVARADYDNDGNPDVLLLRGAWEKPARLSLLRNKGGASSRT